MKLTEEELKEQLELYAKKNDELRARNQELECQLAEMSRSHWKEKEEIRDKIDLAVKEGREKENKLIRGIIKIIRLIGE